MGKLTIKYAGPLGPFDEKYGQRYYGKAHGTDMDISFNMMNPVNFDDGDVIEYEEKVIREKGERSKNPGEEYLFLKKVKRANLAESGSEEAKNTSSSPPRAKESASTAEPSYEAGTNARWALKLSVDTYKSVVGGMPDGERDFETILKFSKWLLKAFGELKNMDGPGKAKAREMAEKIRSNVEDVTDDPSYKDPFSGA